LILGTFNPDIPEGPTFFYGRPRNYLWQLLPGCWLGEPSLIGSTLTDKMLFMNKYKVDFADVITTVDVEVEQEANVADQYIDERITVWKNTEALIATLPNLQAVYFTRKTFQGALPQHFEQLAFHCFRI
jgi:G:T/U-mismatch repair DNA glycosylase